MPSSTQRPIRPSSFPWKRGGAASSSARKTGATRSTRLRSAGALTAFTARAAKRPPRRDATPPDGRSRCRDATAQAERLKNSKATVETQFYGWLLAPLTEPERTEFARLLDVLYQRCKAESKAGFPNVAVAVKEGTTDGE